MYFKQFFLLHTCLIVKSLLLQESESKFRILAPLFVCPKDEEAIISKPDNTVITLQTADFDLKVLWTVRWVPLQAPSQRFTLMLWRTVRTLEKLLNRPQPEPYVYIIENHEMLRGVSYVFSVSEVEADWMMSKPKTFNIDNTQGDNKLMIEGRNDMLSVLLLGSQTAYADAMFDIVAEVTTCFPTQDYYFSWTVTSVTTEHTLNFSQLTGSKLEIPPFSVKAGMIYSILCKVVKHSNGNLITQTNLPFKVSSRGLEVYLSFDHLQVSANYSFSIESKVINHDYDDTPVSYKWNCQHADEKCGNVEYLDDEILIFPNGLPLLGEYTVTLTVSVLHQMKSTNATITVIGNTLPVIQVTPLSSLLNEGSEVVLVANASNVSPTCSLSWYFTSKKYLESQTEVHSNDSCDDCQHGELLSDTLTIYSLEEQFLSELADYTNETEWRQVTTNLTANEGRARFVANCGCSMTFDCNTLGVVYADIWLEINPRPKPRDIKISPASGTALETIFRISTQAATDPHTPLRYTFYCGVEYDSFVIGTFSDHRVVETFLPYMEAGTEIWVEVCDALGACSNSRTHRLNLLPGDGRTVDAIITDASAHARRCELDSLHRVAMSAIVTYTNNKKAAAVTKFLTALRKELSTLTTDCIEQNREQYSNMLAQLNRLGVHLEE